MDYSTDDDQNLLIACKERRDGDAFEALCLRHSGLVQAACHRQCSPDVDEAVQAVFLVLARRAGAVPAHALAGWLTITSRQIVEHQRRAAASRRRHEQEASIEQARQRATAGADPSWDEARQHLDAALANLSVGRREAVLRFYLEGKPQAQVAAELGCSVDAVKTRVHEGLEGLRRFFARKGIALGAVALASGLASEATASEPALVATCVQTALTPATAPGAAALAHGAITTIIIKTASLVAAGIVLAGSCLTAALVVGAERAPTSAAASTTWTSGDTPPHELHLLMGRIESLPLLPLARRIRAHADGRPVQVTMRTIAAPPAFWSEIGFAGDGPLVLDSAQTTRVLTAVSTDQRVQVLGNSSLKCPALGWGKNLHCFQQAYVADYNLVNGAPDSIVPILSYGNENWAYAEPVADDIVLVRASVIDVHLLGWKNLDFTWPVNGVERSYPLRIPVCLIEEGRIAPETRLRPGEAVAVPLVARVQRDQPKFGYAIDQRIPDPDLNARPRSVCLFTAEVIGPPQGGLAAKPEASAWLDGTRVSLDLHDVPLDVAVRSLMAQLPVPVEVDRDADYAATRVSLTARDEPARAVLGRLLGQCLLEGSASVGLLRLTAPTTMPWPMP